MLVVGINDLAHLGVDLPRGVIRHRLGLAHLTPEEGVTLFLAVIQRPQFFREPPLGHHVAGDLRGALDIVRGPGGHLLVAEDDFLRQTSTEQARQLTLQARLGMAVAVFLGQEHGHTQGTATRDDADLVHRVVLRHRQAHDRMPGLVIGGQLLLVLGHHHGLALGAHHDLVLGTLEVGHVHQTLVGAGREQRRLVDQVRQIRPGETRRTTGNQVRAHILRDRGLLHVDLEDLLAAAHVRRRHHHLAVEAARAQQRRVQHVRAVGRGDHDDPLGALKAVHLDQQLVQRLLALVVTTAHAGATLAADRVDLVDEDNAGGVLLGLGEHVAHARGAHADKHLDEVGTGDAEERHLGLACDGLGQQRLPGTR